MIRNETVIRVADLSKMYKCYTRPRDMAMDLFSRKTRYQEFWALTDISFEVQKGEVVGIVGPNGAGKSTLLKILARTLNSSSGQIAVSGKIAALLELGTGFNPEYTGRENIIFGGMCLGMTKTESLGMIDSIIEFSELGKVIDQPFKTYSSGMQSRLTFSVAMNRKPDIFIIDEALATGDSYFVQKCIDKIHTICRDGTTVLFVSHSTGVVAELCNRALWLDKGRLLVDGPAGTVCKSYEQSISKRVDEYNRQFDAQRAAEVLTEETPADDQVQKVDVRITKVEIWGDEGTDKTILTQGEVMTLRIHWEGHVSHEAVYPSFIIENVNGVIETGARAFEQDFVSTGLDGQGIFEADLGPVILGAGDHYLSVGIFCLSSGHKEVPLFFGKRLRKFSVRRKHHWPYTYLLEPPVYWKILS